MKRLVIGGLIGLLAMPCLMAVKGYGFTMDGRDILNAFGGVVIAQLIHEMIGGGNNETQDLHAISEGDSGKNDMGRSVSKGRNRNGRGV